MPPFEGHPCAVIKDQLRNLPQDTMLSQVVSSLLKVCLAVPGKRTPGKRTPGKRTPGKRTPGKRTPELVIICLFMHPSPHAETPVLMSLVHTFPRSPINARDNF